MVRRWTPQNLSPGCFSFVMATGIVAVGANLKGLPWLAWPVMVIAAVGYLVLVLASLWRLVGYPRAMLADLRNPGRTFGYFTFVAGSNVLAVCLTDHWPRAAAALLIVATLAWFVLGYLVPGVLVIRRRSDPLLASATGSWFVWVVASQSVAVVAATLEPVLEQARLILAVLAVLTWSVGLVLYAAAAVFVSLRMMLFELAPQELDPAYWVAMGAVAITVVAGARIVDMNSTPIVDAVRELVAGLAVVLWSFASWLIPVLVAAGLWRHLYQRVPLRYELALWSIVFPLGMYAVAGMFLGRAESLPLLQIVGQSFFWVGLTAWGLTLAGMLWTAAAQLSRPARWPGPATTDNHPSASD